MLKALNNKAHVVTYGQDNNVSKMERIPQAAPLPFTWV